MRARLLITSLVVASVAGLTPGSADPLGLESLTLSGPETYLLAEETPFTGRLTIGDFGVPRFNIDLLVDGEVGASGVTADDGTFSVPVVFTSAGMHTVQAVAHRTTPLEIVSNVVTIDDTSVSLTIVVEGMGTVHSGDGRIACPPVCSASFVGGSRVALFASAASGWTFDGWIGACESGTDCEISLLEDRTVGVRFSQSPA